MKMTRKEIAKRWPKIARRLVPLKRGLTLSPWRMRTNTAYSERGGDCGREWTRKWIMTFKQSSWFRDGRFVGVAAIVRLNGDGIEVRGRACDMDGRPMVKCAWTNGNGVPRMYWPHPQGWKWVGVMRKRPTVIEHRHALEREMGRQRREIDVMLRKAMLAAGWAA